MSFSLGFFVVTGLILPVVMNIWVLMCHDDRTPVSMPHRARVGRPHDVGQEGGVDGPVDNLELVVTGHRYPVGDESSVESRQRPAGSGGSPSSPG